MGGKLENVSIKKAFSERVCWASESLLELQGRKSFCMQKWSKAFGKETFSIEELLMDAFVNLGQFGLTFNSLWS